MQRNSTRNGGHVTTPQIAVKPPKPPCWLDLKAQKSASDDGVIQVSPTGNQHQINRSGKTGRRCRPKLHRTRSQFCIQSEDLPDFELTTSLAETKPEDLGLGKEQDDDTVIMQETARKCRTWLQSIQGCGPPEVTSCLSSPEEEVVSQSLTQCLSSPEEEVVDVEVPDQTPWYDDPELCPLYNSSASDSDGEFNVSLSNMTENASDQNLKSPKPYSSRTIIKNPGRKYELRNCDKVGTSGQN
ncbi:hypothetical protein FSP39_002823 [Pinctada imbricata]|uniref:Uncharacterized protein n=1 Tax=Pinctada imbricata TaxID=66713 RepID=A0AA88YDI7_PINIB|nr:hypothetical protein FSP39_002823 [Pinctada imbricata]